MGMKDLNDNLRNIVNVLFDGQPIKKSAFLDKHHLPAGW